MTIRGHTVARLSRGGMRWASELPPTAMLGGAFALVLIVMAIAPQVFAPYPPLDIYIGPAAAPPSADHWFGTDELGRDVFSRVIWGSRVSVTVGLLSSLLSLIAGSIIGAVAATSNPRINYVIMRLLDTIISFPGIILAVVMATVMGPGLTTTVLVLSILYTPAMARVVRANVLVQYQEDYVAAELIINAPRWHILLRHVMINTAAPVIVFATVIIADAILVEAALSFISVGIQPPAPSWGNIVNGGRELVNSGGWWVTTFGGLAIFLTVLSLNAFAEGIADAFGAPRIAVDRKNQAHELRDIDDQTAPEAISESPILKVENLSISIPKIHGQRRLVQNVSLDIGLDEVLGLVGESGSGKSLIGLAIMGLLPPEAEVTGRILYEGRDITRFSPEERRALCGPEMAMVFQNALSALNPTMTVKQQLEQLCQRGSKHSPADLMDMVHLSAALLKNYPHQLSGGQRQRVVIAMALSRDPKLIIADEPTTALDETVQAQIVALLNEIRSERQLSLLFVSHDLAFVSEFSDRVLVLYGGQSCEQIETERLQVETAHPYTSGLLRSILSLERGDTTIEQIEGTVPAPHEFSQGCRFVSRCPRRLDKCETVVPVQSQRHGIHTLSCHNPREAVGDAS